MTGWGYGSQSFTYNSMLQLTNINGPEIDIVYNYSATQNNGKIISQVDMISGEQVNYTYDLLNRLATAHTLSNPNVTQWARVSLTTVRQFDERECDRGQRSDVFGELQSGACDGAATYPEAKVARKEDKDV